MRVIVGLKEMLAWANKMRQQGHRIGFVPTMGYLHDGHFSLIERARQVDDIVVCSIFVNPAQFGPQEDFGRYPRDLARDESLTEKAGVDILFCPRAEDIYPDGFKTRVSVESLSGKLCGRDRPGHFGGVTTIVAKLFNLVKPHNAYFGQKDAQQFVIIRQMVEDLNFDIQLHMLPIIREKDGLALSSRNKYLNDSERKAALVLSRAIKQARGLFERGIRTAEEILAGAEAEIAKEKLARLDYLALVDMASLEAVKVIAGAPVLLAMAIRIGGVRLIDNTIFNEENLWKTTWN